MYEMPSPSQGEWTSTVSPAMPPPSHSVPTGAVPIMASRPPAASARPPRAPSATRLDPAPNRSEVSEPVNPWEARWKAAGARLLAAAERPRTLDKPHPSQSLDRYSSVPLKEPSVPPGRATETTFPQAVSRGFDPHPVGRPSPYSYPAPPSAVPYVTTPAHPVAEPLVRHSESLPMIPKPQPREIRDEESTSSKTPLPEAMITGLAPEPASCAEELNPSVTSIGEANPEWSEPESGASSRHDLSEWIEYYLPHDPSPPTDEGVSISGNVSLNSAADGPRERFANCAGHRDAP